MVEQIEVPEKKSYGDIFGKFMSSTSQKFQYQSSMAGYFLILLSLTFYVIFTLGWGVGSLFWRVFAVVNSLCGILIIYSQLITTFQQYLQFKAIQNVQDLFSSAVNNVNTQDKEKNVAI